MKMFGLGMAQEIKTGLMVPGTKDNGKMIESKVTVNLRMPMLTSTKGNFIAIKQMATEYTNKSVVKNMMVSGQTISLMGKVSWF